MKAAGELKDTTVIEVGPGPGSLTRSLLKMGAKQVIAVEKDKRYFSISICVPPHSLPSRSPPPHYPPFSLFSSLSQYVFMLTRGEGGSELQSHLPIQLIVLFVSL